MVRAIGLLVTALLLLPQAAAWAQEFSANAVFDFDVVAPAGNQSFMYGGLGKTEFSSRHSTPVLAGQALADLRAQFDPSLAAFATVRVAPDLRAPFDVLEAYGRYQPVSTKDLVWTIKTGAFFPPISLENEGVGWTSPWTLTSSAINSWVGAELRTIGGETSVEWRYPGGALGWTGAVFAANDPAGALLADRGWTFDSRPVGLLGRPRLPDVTAAQIGLAPPLREEPFKETDGQAGWYSGLSLRQDGLGRFQALYYDNRADPGSFIGTDFGWRTKFASFGGELDIGDVVVLSQVMTGNTTIEPFENFYSKTNFQSGYVLAGYYFGDYRVAARVDLFATQQINAPGGNGPGEHGHALTLAGSWAPRPWLRFTAEMLRIDSSRSERALAGLPIRNIELQGRLVGRLLF
jgi:hypothetical protein